MNSNNPAASSDAPNSDGPAIARAAARVSTPKLLGQRIMVGFSGTSASPDLLRRVRAWAGRALSGEILTRTLRLCARVREYGQAYAHPKGHRTSTMLDRVMRSMSGYFDGGQHLHGSSPAARQHVRAWALLHNFAPWGPETERASGYGSPAERLNGHRYHDNWLHNLLVSASLAGFRQRNSPPHNA